MVRRYPPRRGEIQVPVDGRRNALAGMGLLMLCRPLPLVAHHLWWAAVGLAGPRLLPGAAQEVEVGLSGGQWEALCADVARVIGPFDSVALLGRRQETRPGAQGLLLREGRGVAFFKVRPTAEPLAREQEATALLSPVPGRIRVPRPLGQGSAGDLHWAVCEALPPWPHRPAGDRLAAAALRQLLPALAGLPRPVDTPSHWTPMHGDFGPWNLRRVGTTTWALDWETSGYGPPGADEVYWQAARAALAGRPRSPERSEAVEFWRRAVNERLAVGEDPEMNGCLLAALGGVGGT